MNTYFEDYTLGDLRLKNRFVFPPVKTAYADPQGFVTDHQVEFYRQIATNGPGLIILEPVSVTARGREHPKQLSVHLPESSGELKKIVDAIHGEDRLACLHLNHAGAAANPKAIGTTPKAPSKITCPSSEQSSDPLSEKEIKTIVDGFRSAAEKAVLAGFDLIEIQGGHGYLISQFLNQKINHRSDSYGKNRLLFASEVFSAVKEGAPTLPIILRISGNEMSPEFGIEKEDLLPLLRLASDAGAIAIHAGMGSACFSPPWYFQHASLPEKPQTDALSWIRSHSPLPVIAAGRMGRFERAKEILDTKTADLIALGRPLIADPHLLEKWQSGRKDEVIYCGYCLQGCLHRVKNGKTLGCNLNPTLGLPELTKSNDPKRVLVAGGGPAGLSAALYLSKRGHQVILAEKENHLGGQYAFAWQAPGKEKMQDGLQALEDQVRVQASVLFSTTVDAELVKKVRPDLLVWATGVMQNIPGIDGLGEQNSMTSLEFFKKEKPVIGPRVLVIGAGRTGLEIVDQLGKEGFEVVATKRSNPVGSGMDMLTKKLTLMRIEQMPNVTIMPQTTVKKFKADSVEMEKDSKVLLLEPFQTVILASGMLSAVGPDDTIKTSVSAVEVIGDAWSVRDIFHAVRSGYEMASRY